MGTLRSAHPCMGLFKSSGFFGLQLVFLVPCFCWPVSRFDRGTVSPSRPRFRIAPRAAAVKAGRRPPPEAARSGLDGGEHGARLWWSGGASGSTKLPVGSEGSSPAAAELSSVPQQPCIRATRLGSVTMMQSCASSAKLRRAGPFYKNGTKAMGGHGTPPPRIVIGSVSPEGGHAPNRGYLRVASITLISPSAQPATGAGWSFMPSGTLPVVTSSQNATKSLRASATIMTLRVSRRPSAVRARYHWTNPLCG